MPLPIPDSLHRFVEAQATAYAEALAEMRQGRKRTHWMWYIFPQLQGLGMSSTAQYYGLRGAAEAAAYLAHPLLGARLREIAGVLPGLPGHDATRLMGSPDDLKLRSCMTLFAALPGAPPVFQAVLDKYFQGRPDARTLQLLERAG